MIREARPNEAETLAEIRRDAARSSCPRLYRPELYPFPLEAVRARWAEAVEDPELTALVAEWKASPQPWGCRAEWLDGLYARPEHWGRGPSPGATRRGVHCLRKGGSRRCHLWVLEANDQARGFYERLGWRETAPRGWSPFPPHPIDVGYTIELETTLAKP